MLKPALECFSRGSGIQLFAQLLDSRLRHAGMTPFYFKFVRGYDLRLTAQDEIVIIEANLNPFLASDEDFALSAKKAGLTFNELIGEIVKLGIEGSKS